MKLSSLFSGWSASSRQPKKHCAAGLSSGRRQRYRPILEILELRLAPALYFVGALTDTGAGGGNTGDLLYCINQANAGGAGSNNTILFAVSGLIGLTASLPAIANNLTLSVPANFAVIVNGNQHGPVFAINAGETVSVSGLTITDGSGSNGGGINNAGTLSVSNCTLTGNASPGSGGGIYNSGALTVSNCTISGNSASSFGGGIYNTGALTVSNCTISDNSANIGGGIVNNGGATLTVSNCTLAGNSATNYGGGIVNNAGGLVNQGGATLTGSTLSGNSATNDGGGIVNNGNLAVNNSTLPGNSTIEEGGGIVNDGTLTVSNCTLAGNSVTNGPGGGILNQGTLAVNNSTLSGNSVSGSGTRAGGISSSNNMTLHDTILAGNIATGGASDPDVAGAVSASVMIGGVTYTEGYNLIGNSAGISSGVTNGVNGDQVGTAASPINPELGPLQNNGGPTLTMALLVNSPAINAGDPNGTASLPQYDQRGPGFPRIVGPRADIGAFESSFPAGPASQLVLANLPSTVVAGEAFNFEVDVEDSHGNLVTGDSSEVTVALGSGASFTGGSTTVQANGGIADFIGQSIQKAGGPYALTFSDGSLTPPSSAPSLTVTAAAASSITPQAGTSQSATVAMAYGTNLAALVTDPFGNPVNGVTVTFTAPTGGAGGAFGGGNSATAVSNSSGVATAPAFAANTVAGGFVVSAAAGALATTFSLTNQPAAASHFAVMAPLGITAGVAFAVTITALDAYGNLAPGYAGTAHFTTTAASATLPANTTLTLGTGTFPVVLFTAGNQTVTAADTAIGGPSGNSGTIVVNPTADPTFSVSAPASTLTGMPFTFTVTAHDEFNNPATLYSGTVHFTSSDPAAVFASNNVTLTNGTDTFTATLKTAGSQTITATDTSVLAITGTSSAIQAAGLQVTSVVGNPTGFTVNFNKPFDPATLKLYGTTLDNPSLLFYMTNTNVGPSQLTGSVVPNAADTAFTLVETTFGDENGGLPNGVYDVSLLAGRASDGSPGLRDTNGAPLDASNSPNTSPNLYSTLLSQSMTAYSNSFTLSTKSPDTDTSQNIPTQVAVSLPAFAQGPGLPVNVQVHGSGGAGGTYPGIPATISDGNNAGTVSFSVAYNTAMLTVTGGIVDPSILGSYPHASFNRTATGVPVAGIETDNFTFSTGDGSLLSPGSAWTLGDITASVPNAPGQQIYKDKQLLTVSNSSSNGTAANLVGGNGFEVVAYLGDASGDGNIQLNDATLANNVGNPFFGGGFPAFTKVDPVVLADTDGAGFVDASSVGNIASLAIGHAQPTIPTPPAGRITASGGADADVSLPNKVKVIEKNRLLAAKASQPSGAAVGVTKGAVLMQAPADSQIAALWAPAPATSMVGLTGAPVQVMQVAAAGFSLERPINIQQRVLEQDIQDGGPGLSAQAVNDYFALLGDDLDLE